MHFDLDTVIRKVPNFPKEGILFYDITGLLSNPAAMQFVLDSMINIYKSLNLTHVVAVESRGFIFASPLSIALKIPLILARKKGKLPHKTICRDYSLEYGKETLEIQEIDLVPDMNILLIDDLIATGGTLDATAKLLESKGAEIAGIFSVIGLPFLNYEKVLNKYTINTLVNYETEKIEGIA